MNKYLFSFVIQTEHRMYFCLIELVIRKMDIETKSSVTNEIIRGIP